jgi:hypothetical protein
MFSFWFGFAFACLSSLPTPGNSGRSSREISKGLNFLIHFAMRLPPSHKAPAGQDGETGRGFSEFAQAAASQQSHLRNVSTDPRNAPKKGTRRPDLAAAVPRTFKFPFNFSGTT